ncbi:aldehyde dehydrogenase [Alteromonas sp. KUL42]|uniref:xanthine dehydrogenase family protein molybdopterin-binding subunit n=1 Tax=Alteromonas sp. KUL42 TaxID=2480797 RepID=UPI000AF6B499|nr:molybdopterin cofactor-binding domain-containing protein [Alteromonas sp. KUL42]TAP38092.1 xanthine dehydrogenase family protein molybdopterin-binding subunit [Alteromonas sp. KUL42]GEA05293.1 aldehyde dehydrogenase [Alteromonas sp. KUL42]
MRADIESLLVAQREKQEQSFTVKPLSLTLNRRQFLKATAVGSCGLVVGISLNASANASSAKQAAEFNPNAFIHLQKDGSVLIYCGRCEMGQGISTALPSVVADEMEADWSRVTVEQAEGDQDKYGSQATGGSASIRTMYEPMRKAGAVAREMLVAAAAKVWATSPDNCYAENHFVINKTNQQKLSYGELASVAATMPTPENPTLKAKSDFRYIGSHLPRHDVSLVIQGKRQYGVDTKVDGMQYAAIVHCPVMGGTLKSVDKTEAMKVQGVTAVVEIAPMKVPFGSLGGVAVVANNSWSAQQGVEKLKVEWDRGEHGSYNTSDYMKMLVENVEKPANKITERGDVESAFANAAHKVSATYTEGHLVHAPMEPNASVVSVQDGACEVWASTQSPDDIQSVLSQFLGIDKKAIKVNVMISGGAFGRKFKCDYVQEAAAISKAVGTPIQLTWTREEDTRTGFYHSNSAQHIEASLDKDGNVTGWLHRAAFPSINTLFDPSVQFAPANAMSEVENHPYGIANLRSESGLAPAHTRIGWYRAVYAIFWGFAYGVFTDELAEKAGVDTATMLRRLYDSNSNPKQAEQVRRSRGVLDLVVAQSGYGKALPEGEGIGIAVHHSFLSYVAMAVHVRMKGDDFEVLRVDSAVDCGQVLNKDGATAQQEGAVAMGISLAKYCEVSFENGAVVNSNFHDYPVMRINDMPDVHVHFVDSDAKPTGLGEPGMAPFAPALSNAIYQASGTRYRSLPIQPMRT